ncbi:HAD family hydrolase [Puniceicoccus vermicola]|uniref:HAD family phosphatase n=1 Tax=Puniceicoccus vermicola TaxID=388746 RepID=A0A7X1B120_9BACT|nr:HAD family phosphatase [Puniceicoccus vermicola]MBC2603661.1 HAD family phosphatase [Puniceicoccus vermicola]
MSDSVKFGVLFDWDGVVVDSSSHHYLSWQQLAEEIGESITEEQFRESFGQVNRVIIPDLLGWSDDSEEIDSLGARKEELYRKIVREKGLDPLLGARELVQALKAAGIPRVVGTSSETENIETALEVMGMEGLFDGIVASEDVTEGKPDPEVFLKAAKITGLPPAQCVVLEDSHHGLQAADAGGMKSVGVLTTHPKEKLGSPDLFVSSLQDLSVEALKALFS